MQEVVEAAPRRVNLTATQTIPGVTALLGLFVAQASNVPTLKVQDDFGTIANTFTPTAGNFYALPCRTSGGVVVTVSGTVDCTLFYG
jgi:hypothetical protein